MSKVNLKSGDIIHQYDREGNFAKWLRKLELVADLQGVTALEKFLLLFLCSGAFSVYESLADNVWADFYKLKAALTSAFCSYAAYEAFVSCRYI